MKKKKNKSLLNRMTSKIMTERVFRDLAKKEKEEDISEKLSNISKIMPDESFMEAILIMYEDAKSSNNNQVLLVVQVLMNMLLLIYDLEESVRFDELVKETCVSEIQKAYNDINGGKSLEEQKELFWELYYKIGEIVDDI